MANGSNIANYGFDLVGNLQSVRYGNGVTNLYQYDALNRLTNLVWKTNGSLSATVLASFAYQLKAGGTRTNLAEIINNAPSPVNQAVSWSYDTLYRLTGETVLSNGASPFLTYAYDAVGNRTARNGSLGGLGAQTTTYDTNDWITTDIYDANGNTKDSGGIGYVYDALNRLVSSGTTNFAYDADVSRISKSVGSVNTYYLVDDRNPSGSAQVLEEYRTSSLIGNPPVLNRVYSYGLGLITEQQFTTNTLQPSVLSYYAYDGHGSVRFLMDTNGSITDIYIYDAFGTLLFKSGTTSNNYLYCGQQFDPDLSLYYNRARYMTPGTGRFLSSDSFEGNSEDPLSLHKYLYGADNPVNGWDPSGHDDLTLGSVLTASAIGATIGGLSAATYDVAKGRAITAASVFQGAAWGAVLGPYTVAVEGFGLFLGAVGLSASGATAYEVYTDPNATFQEKFAASTLVVTALYGTTAGMNYRTLVNRAGPQPALADPPTVPQAVPNFPLSLKAPPGIVLKSMQPGLNSTKMWQVPGLMKSMKDGQPIPALGGYKQGNVYYINEGNHRVTAALMYYQETGDSKPLTSLLDSTAWANQEPSGPT